MEKYGSEIARKDITGKNIIEKDITKGALVCGKVPGSDNNE